MFTQVLDHALHGAGDGVGAATGQRVARIRWKLRHIASGNMQARRAALLECC